MPKNKKPAPFMVFVMDYKKQFPNITLENAISKAGDEWKNMSEQQKSHYKNRAKTSAATNTACEKYTSQGVPLSHLEKQKEDDEFKERLMKKEIEHFIIGGRNTNTLSARTFYFIMGNYFVRNGEGSHVPGEIALCEFSLENGIQNKYHSFINPGDDLFGHAYEAVEHAKNTHNLPLPPNAMGEKNLPKLYSTILKFIQSKNDNSKEIPPVYTIDSNLPVLKSILNYLQKDCHFDIPDIPVYSLHYLFYFLKKTTSEIGDTKQVDSIHITNAILDRDYYEYQSGIACEYHENIDKTNFCALSYVIRWAYTFSDNMCMDLGITLKAGVHISSDADLSTTNTQVESDFNETESIFSLSTNYTEPKIEDSVHNNSSFSFTGEHFPKLTNVGMNKSKKNNKKTKDWKEDADTTLNETICGIENIELKDDENPWLTRYKNKPREPNDESFSFNVKKKSQGRGINFSQNDSDSESSIITPRGRGMLWSDSFSTSAHTSFGRGRLFD